MIAVDGNRVEMELVISGADIVGFERKPNSDAERESVQQAARDLKDTARMFQFDQSAGCVSESSDVESGLIEEAEAGHDEGHQHGRDDDEHAEFHVHYVLECSDPDALTQIDVMVFQHFPGAHALEVQAITPRGQIAAELTAGANRLMF